MADTSPNTNSLSPVEALLTGEVEPSTAEIKTYKRPNPRFMDGKYELYELTDAQKQVVLDNYTKMTLGELTKFVWDDPYLDGRAMEGRSIRFFLSGLNKDIKTTESPQPIKIALTSEQKRQIEELAPVMDSVMEITQAVFRNPSLRPQTREWRAVYAHYKEVYPQGVKVNDEPVEEDSFTAPTTFTALVAFANRHVMTGDPDRKAYNHTNLRVSDERCLKSLSKYIRIRTFGYVASQYDKQVDRDLFVSTFVRWTHDKPDLTEIEVDQMISAAAERVNIAQIDRSIQRLDKLHEAISMGLELDDNGKKKKLGMADIELINAMRAKHDQAKGRLKDLMASLETSRSKRLSARDERNATVLTLFEAWMTDEQKRKDIIAMGQREKLEDKREVGRLRDLDDLVALVSGQTEEDAAV